MNSYTLIIWEEIPENTTLYLIPDEEISDKQRHLLGEADGKVIGWGESPGGVSQWGGSPWGGSQWGGSQ